MNIKKRHRTLQLRKPNLRTVSFALAMLVVFLIVVEGTTRTEFVRNELPPPRTGSNYAPFEAKLARLDALVEREGSVGCIFLGSSMVHRGIDPVAFSRAYRDQTNDTLQCFNFGLAALTASEAGVLGSILVDLYHPRMLVYATSARDFDDDFGEGAERRLIESAWTQYYLGKFSMTGWLSHRSSAYGYYLMLIDWYRPRTWQRRRSYERTLSELGFAPFPQPEGVRAFYPPDLQARLADFEMSREDLVGLERLIELPQHGTQLVLVELPLPDSYYGLFEDGEQTYCQGFLRQVDAIATRTATPFVITNGLDIVGSEAWYDYHHLTGEGAAVFSQWLAQRIAEANSSASQPASSSPTQVGLCR